MVIHQRRYKKTKLPRVIKLHLYSLHQIIFWSVDPVRHFQFYTTLLYQTAIIHSLFYHMKFKILMLLSKLPVWYWFFFFFIRFSQACRNHSIHLYLLTRILYCLPVTSSLSFLITAHIISFSGSIAFPLPCFLKSQTFKIYLGLALWCISIPSGN